MSGEGTSRHYHVPGSYNFIVRPGLENTSYQCNSKKNVEFTFSTVLNCLYVKKSVACPFGISTTDVPPANSKIKVHVYSEDEVPVMRCRAHSESELEGTSRQDFVSPWHFMRCHNDSGTYHCCDKSGELSIFLPYTKPECVAENVENFIFLCSSKHCIKKELFIKFSLINSEEVLGHQIFGLHVCSSPGRDCFNHENPRTSRKRKRKMPADTRCSTENSVPPSQESHEKYQILVKERWIYNYIAEINRALELSEAVPLEEQERYLKRHRARQALSSHTVSAASSSSDTRTTLRRILVKF